MADRPHAERYKGKSVLRDIPAGYIKDLTRAEMSALLVELAHLIELDVICEGRIPPRHTLAEGDRPHSKSPG